MVDRPLRVVMPALTFVPGAMGGSETYVRELITALLARDDVDLTVMVSSVAAGAFPGADELVVDRVRGGAGTVDRLRSLAQAIRPGRTARALMDRADVVHYPFTVAVPGPRRVPWVQTLLDVQHRDLPEMFSPAERAYRALAYDRGARHADRVITISEFSRTRIIERLGVDPARVAVAHLGVDDKAFPFHGGEREPFVFYPATAWPHKNHARLIKAMSLVRAERSEMRLVLTGGRRAALGALPDWVEHRGHVSNSQLSGLYRTASCLVFPSLYEGFGLPPLEAMSSGCPVAAGTAGALPEVCADAAVTFDATDPQAIADGILRALADARELTVVGARRAKQFTWAACADAHVSTYADACVS